MKTEKEKMIKGERYYPGDNEEKQVVNYLNETQQVVGIRFTAEAGIPFLVRAHYSKGAGNIIYGAITTDEDEADKFVIHYKNGGIQVSKANNNTFIIEYPTFLTDKVEDFYSELDQAFAYDKWRINWTLGVGETTRYSFKKTFKNNDFLMREIDYKIKMPILHELNKG